MRNKITPLNILVQEQAKKYGNRTALKYRDYSQEKWLDVSWIQFAEKVNAVSRALMAMGVRVQENIAVFSQNMPECFYCDFGAYGIRAVTIPFYATSSEAQVQYMLNDAEVRFMFVGEQQQYDTAFRSHSLCPTLQKLIIFSREVVKNPQDTTSIYFDEFLATATDAFDKEIEERKQGVQDSELVNILYTSGTTGESKGVTLRYSNYYAAFDANIVGLPELSENDVVLNFLPFTHVFERAWSYLCIHQGCTLAVNLRPVDVLKSMREVHPSCMCAVPRFWEKVYAGVQEKIASSSGMQKKLLSDALECGHKYNVEYRLKGLTPPLGLKLKYKFYESTVISLLKKTLGLENANFFPTAGAAVPPKVEELIHAVGINMMVGYGLTESTATVSNDLLKQPISIGSIGRPIYNLEVKIGENDEILLRGETITKGYYKKDAATKAAIDEDGWFHTGDAGYIKDGELYLTDRIKDLFKTSNGKYIAPQMLESKFVVDRYIDQISIIADQRKFASALIIPNYDALKEYAENKGISYNSIAELCKNKQVNEMFKERIDTLQQEFAHYEQIKKFVLLPEPFSMAKGELTNTLKVKRPVLYKNYQAEIDAMYAE